MGATLRAHGIGSARPAGCLGESAKNSAIAKTMGQRCCYVETEAHRLGAEDPSDYALHVVDSRLNRNNNEAGTQENLRRGPYTRSIFRLGQIFSRAAYQTKMLFYGRCGLATNYRSGTKLGSAIRADQLVHLYPQPVGSTMTNLHPQAISYFGKLAEQIRKTCRPSKRTARKKGGKSLNPPHEYDSRSAG
jgi:hypothetical protein